MPRAGQPKPEQGRRLRDRIALGVLTASYPQELVDQVLEASGRRELRYRLLPARMVVYYVLAMTLFREAGYEEVLRELTAGLTWRAPTTLAIPSSVAISKARARLGAEPLAELFRAACVPLAQINTRGAFYRGWRVVSLDGTSLDTADTASNLEAFGRPATGRGQSAFPQLRIVALAESGTRAIFGAALGAYRTGEVTLARELLTGLDPGMLVLADRGFTGQPLFAAMAATGAQLCWRARANLNLPVLERHPDGSFGSQLLPSQDHPDGLPVRVVEYRLEDPGRPQTEALTYRLVTTILDPALAPARELAELYSERWEFESALDELKTHQSGPRVVLRSKLADGVRQEAWGMLCVHYAIRALLCQAAHHTDVDPDRVSFTRSMRAARRSLRGRVGTQAGLTVAVLHAITEILRQLLPPRRLRSNPRVVRRKVSNFALKRPHHRLWPQPTLSISQAIRILSPP